MRPTRNSLVSVALAALHTVGVLGDGVGLLGHGKTLYNPTCAFACRGVIKGCHLACTPADTNVNHGTAHSPVSTPPDCFVKDDAFLRTMALCLDTYCPISDNPSLDLLEDYWASHLGTGTLGNYQWVPAVSYQDALAAARADERKALANNATTGIDNQSGHGGDHSGHGMKRKLKARQFFTESGPEVTSPLPIIKAKAPLHMTSFIAPADWQLQYSGMFDFETNENGHSTYSITVMVVAIFLPVPLSLLRFVPGIAKSRAWNSLQSAMINPALYGKHHREPVAGGVGMMPTRGQALYILLISILNIVFLLAPYVHHHPQSTFGSLTEQELSIIGNRAGVMAMGNVVALFVFAARNNVLLWVTDWSYSTYLLLHRWLGYWAVIHTVIHSFMLWFYYQLYGDYAAELARDYWVWGIVGTVACVAIFPFSLLWVRQAFYEFFVVSHFALSLLFLIGYYYHIWYCYEYAWGYEIWAFVAFGIWGCDRLFRLVRIACRGYRTATVTVLQDTDGEYLRIDIENAQLGEGVAYLTFPSLSWRLWESHPFSVAFNSSEVSEVRGTSDASDSSPPSTPTHSSSDPEKKETSVTKQTVTITLPAAVSQGGKGTTTFLARVRTGFTGVLAKRAAAASGSVRLGVLVDGPYNHSGDVTTQLKQCSGVLYIAGGVGITALFPYLRRFSVPSKFFFATRKAGLLAALEPALAALPASVETETTVGQRLDLDRILEKALADKTDDGPLGIVVCGPPGMADHVRHKVVQLSRNGPGTRPYVLVDEAFGW
ncbi:ferric reductase like transmembrane component-domain-containing protein [Chaetomium tenue]|uniref:Ferric reductase like transmembrane component-domain-containing protein n=1 Tax=Chaetomium tenue TaxID=1854479 RepID=A0ACB7PMN9_9PEZI|nr:ferric reductase like transmembrane component-domain-containing protein [Chaetomium globosum]